MDHTASAYPPIRQHFHLQQHFAGRNNEWPTVPTVKVDNAALEKLGAFKADEVSISEVAKNVPEAQRVFDRAGFR